MTTTAAPICVVDAWLKGQPRGTVAPWTERPAWFRVAGSHGIYGVRGPEADGGPWCPCKGFKHYQHCYHVGAVLSLFPRCPVCTAPVISPPVEYVEGRGYVIRWQCSSRACDYRRTL